MGTPSLCVTISFSRQIQLFKLLLNVPKISTVTLYGQRAFSYVAASLWNSIPGNIRNCVRVEIFKTRLTSFLFKEAFNSFNSTFL